MGMDPMTVRDRQDEAIGVIRKLLRGEERFDHDSDWFTLREAKLHLLPVQEDLPFAVASMISPSGMTLAGKHGTGVLSIGSMSEAGLQALPTQWSFAEDAAREHHNIVDRKDWRIVMFWHIAETREQARQEAKDGLFRWRNEYTAGTLMQVGVEPFDTPDQGVDEMAFSDGATAVIGTPDDLVAKIRELVTLTGGFGTAIGFVHDWANRENTNRSWDLVARYVMPEVNGMLDAYRESRKFVVENRDSFNQARAAIMDKIMSNEKAAAAFQQGSSVKPAFAPHAGPDLSQDKDRDAGD